MTVKLEFSDLQTDLILQALTKITAPWEVTNPLIQYILTEGKKQVDEQQNKADIISDKEPETLEVS